MIKSYARTANKTHWCDCGNVIMSGDRYIEMVVSPDHEYLEYKHWSRFHECSVCATRYGRGDML